MNRRFSILLAGLILCLGSTSWAQQPVPSLTGRVVDLADLLNEGTESTLTTLLKLHEDSTSNQIAVLTIPSLQGETIEDFSLRTAQTWQLGQADLDNGVLITVARDDRKVRIEVGYGLEGQLTDAACGAIIRSQMVPLFREGNYDVGVLSGAQAVMGVLDGTYTPPMEQEDMELIPRLIFGGVFILIPSIFAIIGFFSTSGMRWFFYFFLIPFYAVGFGVLTLSFRGALYGFLAYTGLYHGLQRTKWAKKKRSSMGKGQGLEWSSGGSSGSWSSSSGGSSWSSGSSGSSFSGGGGSFGGGGASGGW